MIKERWPSGLRYTLGKRAYGFSRTAGSNPALSATKSVWLGNNNYSFGTDKLTLQTKKFLEVIVISDYCTFPRRKGAHSKESIVLSRC